MGRLTAELLTMGLLALWVMEPVTEGCMCAGDHFQSMFCRAELVFRAKVTGEKMMSMYQRQYEIKLIKMYKGFNRVNDIQYVYTASMDSMCGIKLDAKNKAEYLLSGSLSSDGTVQVYLCNIRKRWEDLSPVQLEGIKFRSSHLCECHLKHCGYSDTSCQRDSKDQCVWNTSYFYNKESQQHLCLRGNNGKCKWITDKPEPPTESSKHTEKEDNSGSKEGSGESGSSDEGSGNLTNV